MFLEHIFYTVLDTVLERLKYTVYNLLNMFLERLQYFVTNVLRTHILYGFGYSFGKTVIYFGQFV